MPNSADCSRHAQRRRREVILVLALSLGRSAVYAVVALVARLTEPGSLRDQVATLNASVSPRSLLDLTYQLLGIAFALVPVFLALHFLSASREGVPGLLRDGARLVGLAPSSRPALLSDLRWGAGLAAVVGIPGLALYFAARALDINATVVPSALGSHWWTLPVLVLSALQNAVLEEVVVVGFLVTRCRELGLGSRGAVAVSAVLRGSYHLYQGFGAFLGNAVMGVLFATYFVRRRTVLPLVVAHGLIDTVAFVGYTLLKNRLDLP
ncbi:MAG: CPBP family intramembrane glutamic endopeptidase [Nocardioidaceae bacterium]